MIGLVLKLKYFAPLVIAAAAAIPTLAAAASGVSLMGTPFENAEKKGVREGMKKQGNTLLHSTNSTDIFDSSKSVPESTLWTLTYEPSGKVLTSIIYFPGADKTMPTIETAMKDHGKPFLVEGNPDHGDLVVRWKVDNNVALEVSRHEKDNVTAFGYINVQGAVREMKRKGK